MDVERALKTRRSVRRYSEEPVPREILRDVAEMCRFAPSGGNRQDLEVILVDDGPVVDKVYDTLAWLPEVGPPPSDQRPPAYMVVVSDESADALADCASAVTYILLGAHARGVGSCWFGSISRTELSNLLEIPDNYSIEFVVSLGYPAEEIQTVDGEQERNVDVSKGVTTVPKRPLSEMLHINTFGNRG